MSLRKRFCNSNYLFFALILLVYGAVTLLLFHRQTVDYNGLYVSDIHAYVTEMQGQDSGYSFPYPILFWTGRIFMTILSPNHAMAAAVAGWNALSAIMLKIVFDYYLGIKEETSSAKGMLSTVLVFSLLFVSMLYPLTYLGHYREIQDGFLYRYLGTFSPNPYHNATYLASRAFAIPTFFVWCDVVHFYEKEDKWYHPKYLIFSVLLMVTTLTKPSFTLVMVATAGLIMLWRLCRSRMRDWKAFLQLGIYFIPTFLVLLYQFRGVFMSGSGTDEGIGFGFLHAWSSVSDNIPLALFYGMLFPAVVLVLKGSLTMSKPLAAAWQFFLMSLFTLGMLYEKGYRMVHVNFSWGYMFGLFFTYTASLLFLTENTMHGKQQKWKLGIQWLCYGLHLICGLDYCRVLLSGGLFL